MLRPSRCFKVIALSGRPHHCASRQVEGGGDNGECSSGMSLAFATVDNPSYIIYDPDQGTLFNDIPFQPLKDTWPFNLYPFLAVLPGSGSILVITGSQIAAYSINATHWVPDLDWGLLVSLPVPVLYPQTAAITLLPLSAATGWQAQVGTSGLCLSTFCKLLQLCSCACIGGCFRIGGCVRYLDFLSLRVKVLHDYINTLTAAALHPTFGVGAHIGCSRLSDETGVAMHGALTPTWLAFKLCCTTVRKLHVPQQVQPVLVRPLICSHLVASHPRADHLPSFNWTYDW